jgi:chorismate lyase/3-hydroxybenzoate synthase
VDADGLTGWLADPAHILGMIGFGAQAPLPQACPYLATALRPISGETMFEIWTASDPIRPHQAGSVKGAFNAAIAFGAITLAEGGIETAAERAYLEIFDFLAGIGHYAPIRFWNYPVAITGDENGMERYRRFNIGRQRAFSARLAQPLPPAATAVGGDEGASVIYFLAAPDPALAVENPRQVSAFNYPPIHGPRSPSFSRASIYTSGDASCLFISGTASIVGHETRHADNLAAQVAETGENLRALIAAAESLATSAMQGEWTLKIYLQDPAGLEWATPLADAIFGAAAQRIYLQGDICRSDLLVEIEAFRQFQA